MPCNNNNWYNCHLHVPQFFQLPSKFEVLILLLTFFQFYSEVSRDSKVDYFASSLFFFFFCWLLLSLVFLPRLCDLCVCQSIIIIIIICEFFTPALTDGISLNLSDNKFPKVSRTFLSILADLTNAVVSIDSACPPISCSLTKLLWIVPSILIAIGTVVSLLFGEFVTAALANGFSQEFHPGGDYYEVALELKALSYPLRLFGTVVLNMPMWCRSITNAYLRAVELHNLHFIESLF